MSNFCQLRRVVDEIRPTDPLGVILLDQDLLKFGRNPDQVQIVLHSVLCSNMISREHAEIRRVHNQDGTASYYILDRSLNGTYVNEYRVKNSVQLHSGDIIKFGHVSGAAIQPGQHGPQPQSEFTFKFEKLSQIAAVDTTPIPQQQQQQMNAYNYLQNPSSSWAASLAAQSFHPNPAYQQAAAVQAANLQRMQAANVYGNYANTIDAYQATNLLASHPAYAAFYHQCPRQQQQQMPIVHHQQQQHHHQQQQQQQQMYQPPLMTAAWTNPVIPLSDSFDKKFDTNQYLIQQQHQQQQRQQHAEGKEEIMTVECDSSVPTPPKSPSLNKPTDNKPDDTVIQPDDDSFGLSQTLCSLAAESSRLLYNTSPDEPFDNGDLKSRKSKSLSPEFDNSKLPVFCSRSAQNTSKNDAKKRRKSNEVARLLSDLTEGSWMHQAARRTNLDEADKNEDVDDLSSPSSSSGTTSNHERDRGEKNSPLKKRKGFRSPQTIAHSDTAIKKRVSLSTVLATDDDKNAIGRMDRVDRLKKMKKKKDRSSSSKNRRRRRKEKDSGDSEDEQVDEGEHCGDSVDVDEWKFHDPDKLCDARADCSKPQQDNVDWIQCDSCQNWYHVMCVKCNYEKILAVNSDYHCGCSQKKRKFQRKSR